MQTNNSQSVLSQLPIAGGIIITAVVMLVVGFTFTSMTESIQSQRNRDMAVDGCMQSARYTWQEARKIEDEETGELIDSSDNKISTTQEPNRFWYKICMEEKGYPIQVSL